MNDFNNQEKFVDTTGAIRSRKSNDRQYNGLTKKDKSTNNDLQNTTENYRSSNTNSTKNRG